MTAADGKCRNRSQIFPKQDERLPILDIRKSQRRQLFLFPFLVCDELLLELQSLCFLVRSFYSAEYFLVSQREREKNYQSSRTFGSGNNLLPEYVSYE